MKEIQGTAHISDSEPVPIEIDDITIVSIDNLRHRNNEDLVKCILIPRVCDDGSLDYEHPQLFVKAEETGINAIHYNNYRDSGIPNYTQKKNMYVSLWIYPSQQIAILSAKPEDDRLVSYDSSDFSVPLGTMEHLRELLGSSYRIGLTPDEKSDVHTPSSVVRSYFVADWDIETFEREMLLGHARDHAFHHGINGEEGVEFRQRYMEIMLGDGFKKGEYTLTDLIREYKEMAHQARIDKMGEEIVRRWAQEAEAGVDEGDLGWTWRVE